MKRLAPVLTIFAVLALLVTVSALLGRGPQYDPVSDHSSWRTNKWGTRALRELLTSLGLRTGTWTRPWTELTKEASVLWVIHPLRDVTGQDMEHLLAWVRGGGWAIIAPDPRPVPEGVVFGDQRADERLVSALGWRTKPAQWKDPVVPVLGTDPCLADVRSVKVPGEWRLEPESDTERRAHSDFPRDTREAPATGGTREPGRAPRDYLPRGEALIRDREGAVVVSIQLGRGRIILLCNADLLSNRYIGHADNAILAANLAFGAGGGQVWFDEYHRGEGRERAAGVDVRPVQRGLAAMLLAVALFMMGRLQRFGPPRVVKPRTHRSALEYVEAFAALYQQAGQRRAVLTMLVRRLRARLGEVAGTRADAAPEVLAAMAARRRGRLSEPRLAALLRRLDAAVGEGSELDDTELLDLARAISHTQRELDSHES